MRRQVFPHRKIVEHNLAMDSKSPSTSYYLEVASHHKLLSAIWGQQKQRAIASSKAVIVTHMIMRFWQIPNTQSNVPDTAGPVAHNTP